MRNPYDIAEEMCAKVGLDIHEQLAYYELNGFIFSGPGFLILAEVTEESWLVFLAIGNGAMPVFLQAMPVWKPYFSFARLLRSSHHLRRIPTERLCRILGIDAEILKTRQFNLPAYR